MNDNQGTNNKYKLYMFYGKRDAPIKFRGELQYETRLYTEYRGVKAEEVKLLLFKTAGLGNIIVIIGKINQEVEDETVGNMEGYTVINKSDTPLMVRDKLATLPVEQDVLYMKLPCQMLENMVGFECFREIL